MGKKMHATCAWQQEHTDLDVHVQVATLKFMHASVHMLPATAHFLYLFLLAPVHVPAGIHAAATKVCSSPEAILVRLQMVASLAPLHYGLAIVHNQHEPSIQNQDTVRPTKHTLM